MKYFSIIAGFLVLATGLSAQNQAPVISNFVLQTDVPNNSATLLYNLSDQENDPLEVTVQFSTDGGKTYTTLSGSNVLGDVGFPVTSGNRTAVCSGLNFSAPGKYAFRVIADDKQVFDIQALVNEVDSNRLKNDLKFVEGIRHRTAGLAHLNATRDSLQNLFKAHGLYFEKQLFNFGGSTGQNLIASLPGTGSAEKVLVVDAHYDTVSNAPGADDNGSGTVGMMEMARLLSRYPSKKTQRYIGFDLEESGLVGSLNYVASGIPAGEQIEGVFNFEMIGYWSNEPNSQTLPTGFGLLFPLQAMQVADNQYRGDFITNVGNNNSQTLIQMFANSAQQYVPGLKVISLSVPGNGQQVPDLRRSDHAPFWDSNRKALMLTDGANFRNECYHTPGDTLEEKLNFTFMSNVVKATIAAMAQLVELQHADWAAAFFELAVSATEPDPCSFTLLQDSGIALKAEGCIEGEITLEFYDMKGGLLFQSNYMLSSTATLQLPANLLPAGIYALKIRHQGGEHVQKVVVR
jgi:Peptidase family M28